MWGKKEKNYHQKFGATYSYTNQITYTYTPLPQPPPPLPPPPNASKVSWLATWSAQNQKTNNKEKN